MATRYYACDECETLYESYDEAADCEEHHEGCKGLRVVEAKYEKDFEYPTTIIVFSSDSQMSGKYRLSSVWDRSLPQLKREKPHVLTDEEIAGFMSHVSV